MAFARMLHFEYLSAGLCLSMTPFFVISRLSMTGRLVVYGYFPVTLVTPVIPYNKRSSRSS
jgi:hypothetical protein